MTKQIELIVLWVLIVLGFLTHTLADVMPAFWGESIVAMPGGVAPKGMIAFMLILTYTLPALAILGLVYGKCKAYRIANAVLACIFGVFCILHMGEWVDTFNPVQLAVMPLMAVIGVVLAVQSIRFVKE